MTSTNFNSVLVTGVVHGRNLKNLVVLISNVGNKKMLFYLSTLNLAKFLTEHALILLKEETNKKKQLAVDAWKHAKYLCKNYILNGLIRQHAVQCV